jgi:hypothetical protein
LHTASLQIRVLTRVVGHFLDLVDPRFDRCPCAVATQSSSGSDRRWGFAYWFSNQTAFSSPFAFGMGALSTRGLAAPPTAGAPGLCRLHSFDSGGRLFQAPAAMADVGAPTPWSSVEAGVLRHARPRCRPPRIQLVGESAIRPGDGRCTGKRGTNVRRDHQGHPRFAVRSVVEIARRPVHPITRRAAEPVPLTSRSRGDTRLTHGLAHCSFRHAGDVGGRRPRVLYAHHPWIDLVGDPGLPVVAQKSPSPVGEALTKCPRSRSGDRKGGTA